jgi:hypothetical protein
MFPDDAENVIDYWFDVLWHYFIFERVVLENEHCSAWNFDVLMELLPK